MTQKLPGPVDYTYIMTTKSAAWISSAIAAVAMAISPCAALSSNNLEQEVLKQREPFGEFTGGQEAAPVSGSGITGTPTNARLSGAANKAALVDQKIPAPKKSGSSNGSGTFLDKISKKYFSAREGQGFWKGLLKAFAAPMAEMFAGAVTVPTEIHKESRAAGIILAPFAACAGLVVGLIWGLGDMVSNLYYAFGGKTPK